MEAIGIVNSNRKWIIMSTSFGVACALTLAGAYGIRTWYQTRPPVWNSKAIVATFDKVEIVSSEDRILFEYVLHNTTGADYTLSVKEEVEFMTRLKDPPSLMHDDLVGPANYVQLTKLEHVPLFIPAGEGVPFSVSCFGLFPKDFMAPSSADWSGYRRETARIANEQLKNVAGFVIFDKAARYRINLPKGW